MSSSIRFLKTHEWIVSSEKYLRIGVSQYLKQNLGDVKIISFPIPGQRFKAHAPFLSIET